MPAAKTSTTDSDGPSKPCVESIGSDSKSKPSPPGNSFKRFFTLSFRPGLVAAELIKPSVKYRGRDEVLLAGLCAWVLQPTGNSLAVPAMRVKARKLLLDAHEQSLFGGAPSEPWRVDQIRRFRDQIVMPLGGRAKIESCMTPKQLTDKLKKAAEGIEHAHRLMRLWHYLVSDGRVRPDSKKKLSIQIGCELLRDLKYPHSGRTVERYWSEFAKSIALTYAASGVRVDNNTTILDLIRCGELTCENASSKLLADWIGKAMFVDTAILENTHSSPKTAGRFVDLSNLDVAPVPIQASPESDPTGIIDAHYPKVRD